MPADTFGVMKELKQKFLDSLPHTRVKLQHLLTTLLDEKKPESCRLACVLATNLIGSSKMFDRTSLATAAERFELQARTIWENPEAANWDNLATLGNQLLAALDGENQPLIAEEEPLLDQKQLLSMKQLEETSGNDILSGLIHSYAEKFPKLCDDLKTAFTAQDQKKVNFLAHRMKGSSGNIGAKTVMSLCHKLELLSETGTLLGQEELIKGIIQKSEMTISALRQKWLPSEDQS